MEQKHSGYLPLTTWLDRLSLSQKMILAAALASPSFGALAYSTIVGHSLPVATVLLFGSLMFYSWYLLASLCLSFGCLLGSLHDANIRLEDGDFDVRVTPMGNDEGTRLAEQFNDTARELGRIVENIRNAAAEVTHSIVELQSNAAKVADSASQQQQSTSQVVATVEELSESITEMAAQGRDAEQTALAVSDLSASGSRAIAQSSDEIKSLASAINEAAQLMEQLAKRSAEVGQSTGVIREISDQTNLLALNAAIEAARAGEQGRGFAVVADEVRKLAQRARGSADEITHTVATIQNEIRQAVDHMASASRQAQESTSHADGATEVLARIDAQAAVSLSSVHQIASGVEQQSTSSIEIARHVEQIAESTQKNSRVASETAGMAAHLATLASGMLGTSSGARK